MMRGDSTVVLVVDDEPLVRKVAATMLERAGFQIVMAGDGTEALELCQSAEKPIDLLLTDIRMPRMSGLDLANCIAERKLDVPVVFMTGHASEQEVKNMFTSHPGLDGCRIIRKPFTKDELVSIVSEMLGESRSGLV